MPGDPTPPPTPPTPPPTPATAPAPAAAAGAASALGAPKADLKEQIVDVLQAVYDPEIPVNIYDLGLVYDVDLTPEGDVHIRMTLTSPACPVAGTLPPEVEQKVKTVPGVRSVKVEVVWDPPWDKSKLSEAARLQLGFM